MTAATRSPVRWTLIGSLLVLGGMFCAWFWPAAGWPKRDVVALVVFAVPPLWLAVAQLAGARTAAYWAGVLGLMWFSHGIMVAWTRPPELIFALLETALALVVIFSANMPGLRGRFGRRKRS